MFKKATATFSLLLLLAVLAVPAGKVYAQSSDPTVITGTDPEPTGEPRPKIDSGDPMLLALEVALLTALQVA